MILVSFRFLSFLPSALYLYPFLPLPFLLLEIWLLFLNSHLKKRKQKKHKKKNTRSRGSPRITTLADVLTCKLIFAKAY